MDGVVAGVWMFSNEDDLVAGAWMLWSSGAQAHG